nr:MAG TPA: hypothetical protein [Caudoviricetes sp.]
MSSTDRSFRSSKYELVVLIRVFLLGFSTSCHSRQLVEDGQGLAVLGGAHCHADLDGTRCGRLAVSRSEYCSASLNVTVGLELHRSRPVVDGNGGSARLLRLNAARLGYCAEYSTGCIGVLNLAVLINSDETELLSIGRNLKRDRAGAESRVRHLLILLLILTVSRGLGAQLLKLGHAGNITGMPNLLHRDSHVLR